jgi:NTE family protein
VRRFGLVLAAWLLPVGVARAQSTATSAQHPKIGMALSGGAARGLAHIGVLQALEQAGVPVDVVTGTSMGSVVGGLYAVGYTAAQLDSIVNAADWPRLLTDPVDRRDLPVDRKFTEDHYLLTLPITRGGVQLPRSVVPGQRISQLLTRLTWSAHAIRDFRALPTAFAAVATDLETSRAVVLDHGFLPDAMRASMSLPSVFSPVEVRDTVLIDGGVIRNLPAQDARALGASVLICSDVTDPLEPRDSIVSFVDVLVQSVSFRVWDSEAEQRKQCDVLILPDVRSFSSFGFNRARELIARGRSAALAALPEITARLARASRSLVPTARPPLVEPESILVTRVRFDPADLVPAGFLARALGVQPGSAVSHRQLDEGIDRLYATGLFESVGYRLEQHELIVSLRERSAGRFGVGLRYDSRYKASVLLSSTLGRVAGGFSGRADARLGQQIQVGAGVSQPLGDGRSVTLRTAVDYVRSPFDLYQDGHRTAQVRADLGAITASIARSVGTTAEASIRLKAEHARWAEDVSAVAVTPIHRTFYSAAGVVQFDTYDRGLFPRRGVGLRVVSEWANRLAATAGGAAFSHHVADVRGYLPLGRRVSLWMGATVGASGGAPPPHYQFFLGGANASYIFPDRDIAFVGLRTQERRGRHVQKAELGAQWELAPDVFARVRWNAGTVLNRWSFDPARYVDGAGVELGAKTFAGRVSLSASGNAHTTWPIVEIDLGYPF